MQKARRHSDSSEIRPLVCTWFQVLLTPLLGVLFTFPSQYWFAIGLSGVFSLTRWCWQIHAKFHRLRATQDTGYLNFFTSTGLSPSMVKFSKLILFESPNVIPVLQPPLTSQEIWAIPLSLATTHGITIVFSSSR